MNNSLPWGSAPNPEVFKAWRQLYNVATSASTSKGGGGQALPHGIDIASSPHRLSLGGLLLSRARFRFAGWPRIRPQSDDCNSNQRSHRTHRLPAIH